MGFNPQYLLGLIIPLACWVTASIYNQRQELAVLKEILREIKQIAEKANA